MTSLQDIYNNVNRFGGEAFKSVTSDDSMGIVSPTLLQQEESTSNMKLREVQNSITSQVKRLQESQMDVPKKSNKANMLERVFAPLTVFDPRRYAMALTKDYPLSEVFKNDAQRIWKTTIKGERMEYDSLLEEDVDTAAFSDVLKEWGWEADDNLSKYTRATVGLGLDIALDPKTWLTFGAGKAGKLYIPKKGYKTLSDDGMKYLNRMSGMYGSKQGKRLMGSLLKRQTDDVVEHFTREPAVRFLGKDVIPKKWLKKPIEATDEMLQSVPFGGKLYGAVKSHGSKVKKTLLSPFDKVSHMREKLPDAWLDDINRLRNNTIKFSKAKTSRELDRIHEYGKKIIQNTDDASKINKLHKYIEMGGSPTDGNKLLDEFIGWTAKRHDEMWETLYREVGKVSDDFNMGKIGAQKSLFDWGQPEAYIRHFISDDGTKLLDDDPRKVKEILESFGATISRSKKGFMKTRNLKVTIDKANDVIRGKIDDFDGDFFETNAFKILAKETDEYNKALMTINYHKNLFDRFGKRLSKLDDFHQKALREEGEVVIDGITYSRPSLTVFGDTAKTNHLLPSVLVDDIKKVNLLISKDDSTKKFLKLYDKGLSQFKKHVTGIFPAFHMRNLLGATFNNWLAGVKPGAHIKETQKVIRYLKGADDLADDVIKLGDFDYTVKQIAEMAQNKGVFNQPGMMDVMRSLDDSIKQMDNLLEGGLKKNYNKLSDLPRKGFETVENQVRLPLFMERLKQGDDAASAAKQVFKYHFDYAPEALTKVERDYFKRIIPFYTWTRHNIPLQLEQMIKQPGKYAGLEKLQKEMDAVTGTKKVALEREKMPEWMRQMYTMRMPFVKESGEPYYLQMDLPFTDVNKLSMNEVMSMTSPLLKYPVERIMNKEFYFGSKVYDETLPREKQLSEVTKALEGLEGTPVGDFLNLQKIQKKNYFTDEYEDTIMMDSRKLHALRSLWTSRYLSSIRDISDDDATFAEKITKAGLGEPLRPLDLDRSEWSQQKNYDAQLRALIRFYLKHKQMPYSGEKEDFVSGTQLPKDTFLRKLGRNIPGF